MHRSSDAVRWREQGHIFIVADGMGGHAVGEKAAAKAVRDIPHLVPKHASEGPSAAIRRAFLETNAGIHAIGQENPEFRGLGTTASTLWIRPEGAYIGHVGDSRVYRLRDGVIEQLTFDHSAVWELAKRQGMRPEELQGVRSNVILRSLGPEPVVEVDVEGPHPILPGDTFLICSDGLSGQLSDYEIGSILSALPPEEASNFLVELANLRGGPDNITVMIVRAGGPTGAESKAASGKGWPQVPWSVWSMAGGIVLASLTVVFWALGMPDAAFFAFILGVLAVAVGLGGLMVQMRKANETDFFEDEPGTLHVYARTECRVEQGLLDKMMKAEEAVLDRLSETAKAESSAEYSKFRGEADRARTAGDLATSFRAHCRAMHAIVSRFNSGRQKGEVFNPVWDKYK
ncbi:MAG: protein phosphatase 2C domain-containing protein [Gemmataceae bacterium]|nr:protein phosphatase 2C domain-containing protein [Gemmataceae bacterium]